MFRKYSLCLAVILWILAAFQLINAKEKDTPVSVVGAFDQIEFKSMQTNIEAFGEYGTEYLKEEDKEKIIKDIAASLGLNNTYDFKSTREDGAAVMTIYQNGQYAKTTIKLLTAEKSIGAYEVQATQYVSINMTIYNTVEYAMTYKDLIEDIFESAGIEGQVNVNLVGGVKGALNYSERNNLADRLLDLLDADIVSENRGDDLFTIYAYTDAVDDYIVSNGDKININIAVNYDESADYTNIYLSTPLNNLDY